MAVMIKGMEMPDSCFLCRFCRRQEYGEYVGEDTAWSCVASKKRITDGRDLIATFKHTDCPLVEVAEVQDAVSRQAVLDKAYAYGNGCESDGFCVDVEDIQALPSVQPEHKWETCFDCPLSHGCPKIKGCTNEQAMEYASQIPNDCPLSAQPERNAQERYEDLCEYFKDCTDKGMGILGDRKEFKAWLERVRWHVVRCDELGRELEKLQSAQLNKRTDKRTETHVCDSVNRQAAIDEANAWLLDCFHVTKQNRSCGLIRRLEDLPSAQPEQKWVPVSKKLPDDLEEVNITFTNLAPEPYYDFIKGKRFTGSAVFYKGDWYWYSSITVDALKEYGRYASEMIDEGIKVIAWKPFEEPYGGEENG